MNDLINRQPEKRTEKRTETHACDLISRQTAIDALEKVAEMYLWRVPGDRDSYSQYNEAWHDALDRAESEIEALPSAQPEWIPCSERLPDVDGEYLVTKKCFGWNCKPYNESDIARYEKRDGWHKADEVLAWMPLPEPYREGES